MSSEVLQFYFAPESERGTVGSHYLLFFSFALLIFSSDLQQDSAIISGKVYLC
jgi:hypothetical protein